MDRFPDAQKFTPNAAAQWSPSLFRAASPMETTCSSRHITAGLSSLVKCLRKKPVAQFSVLWVLRLNRLFQKEASAALPVLLKFGMVLGCAIPFNIFCE